MTQQLPYLSYPCIEVTVVPMAKSEVSWSASSNVYAANHKGTPGAVERTRQVRTVETVILNSPFRINEVSTGGNWFELMNVSEAEASLKDYQLSQSTALDNDDRLVSFGGKDYKVPAKGVILIVSGTTDADIPESSVLAGGINAATPEDELDERLKTGASSM